MENIVYTKTYDEPEVDMCQIFRNAGIYALTDELLDTIKMHLAEALPKLTYKVVYREVDISIVGDKVKLDSSRMMTISEGLASRLEGCNRAIIFAATIGIEMDRLIARHKAISLTNAVYFHSIGAERIESLCNVFCEEMAQIQRERGNVTRRRFSPGYSDLNISIQKKIFELLDCPRQIGLTLNRSMIMSPMKSVTAFIGISSTGGHDADYRGPRKYYTIP